MDFDVVIIGAGPAGAIAAIKLGQKHRVLILDKTSPAQIRHSGEYVPRLLLSKEPAIKKAIIQEVEGMVNLLPDNTEHFTKAPGYIIERRRYNSELLRMAKEQGCEIKLKAKATMSKGRITACQHEKELRFAGQIYIGADGSHSRIRRALVTKERQYVITLVRELSIQKELKYSYVSFDPLMYGGYAWLFPMGKKVSCGVGVDIARARNLKQAWQVGFERFKEMKLVHSSSAVNEYYNIIYTGGPAARCVHGNIVLVGDAAGQVHPITGAGIGQAVVCSEMLARKCMKALEENDLGYLEEYEKEWRALYEKELKRGFIHRQHMLRNWEAEPFDKVIKDNWVVFDQYYHNPPRAEND